MSLFDYAQHGSRVPESVVKAQRAAWQKIAQPGSWWTGAQRVEMARLCRQARSQRNDPPWLRAQSSEAGSVLPDQVVEIVRRVSVDMHSIDQVWAKECIENLGDAAYVEICAVTVCITAVDSFAEALGVPMEELPSPLPGEPNLFRPEGTSDVGAFVPLLDPFAGPNVSRALSLRPDDNMMFHALVGSMYALSDFQDLVWEDRPLSRPQVELVAARVSSINECFY